MAAQVNPPNDHDLLIRIDARLSIMEIRLHDLEKKVDALQNQANVRKGWFMAVGGVIGVAGSWILTHFFGGNP